MVDSTDLIYRGRRVMGQRGEMASNLASGNRIVVREVAVWAHSSEPPRQSKLESTSGSRCANLKHTRANAVARKTSREMKV